jgi:hypothetical protein
VNHPSRNSAAPPGEDPMIRQQSSFNFCRSSNGGTTFADFGDSDFDFIIDHSQKIVSDKEYRNKT